MSAVGERKPLRTMRSKWEPITGSPAASMPGMVWLGRWSRTVHDGVLAALLSRDNGLLHLSVSWTPNGPLQAPRYPTWDEIADARYSLVEDEATLSMLLPPPSEYVVLHDTTFHLHEIREAAS